MSAETELKRYNDLVSAVRTLRRTGKLNARKEADLFDELEVLEIHADNAAVKASCARALREFRNLPAVPSAAHG